MFPLRLSLRFELPGNVFVRKENTIKRNLLMVGVSVSGCNLLEVWMEE